jgi:hypothetical protein
VDSKAIRELNGGVLPTNGLELLLYYSPFSEHMHQVVLACLLADVTITRALGLRGTPGETRIETHNRLFDISVLMEDGSTVHIELKVDSTIRQTQLERQRENIERSQDQLLYILLGASQFLMSSEEIAATWTSGGTTTITVTEDGVVPGAFVPAYVSAPIVIQLSGLISALTDALPGIADSARHELAEAYLRCLESIQSTFDKWKESPVADWTSAQWNGLFHYLSATLFPDGRVLNHFGQPVLSWGYRRLPTVQLAADDLLNYDVYLDADKSNLCVKLYADFDRDYEDHTDHTKHMRADFTRLLLNAAQKLGVELVTGQERIGEKMTVACLGVGYLTTADSGLLDWNRAVTTLQRIDLVLDNAVKDLYVERGRPLPAKL